MSNTEQLRALRDAAYNSMDRGWCDRAIAALEAEGAVAEQPAEARVVACIQCSGRGTVQGYGGTAPCPVCQAQTVVESPARAAAFGHVSRADECQLDWTAVPPLYTSCSLGEARMHAAATAIAAERDAALERAEKAETKAKQAEYGEQDAEHTADENYRLRVQAERDADEAALAEARRDERERCIDAVRKWHGEHDGSGLIERIRALRDGGEGGK